MISTVGQRERRTQDKVIRYFQDQLGSRYLGNWQDGAGNINLKKELLSQWFGRQRTSEELVGAEGQLQYCRSTDLAESGACEKARPMS